MSHIKVRPKEISIENGKVMGIVGKVERVESTVRSLSYRIEPKIVERYGIFRRMREIQNEVRQLENRIEELCYITELCMKQYRKAENEINRNARAFD